LKSAKAIIVAMAGRIALIDRATPRNQPGGDLSERAWTTLPQILNRGQFRFVPLVAKRLKLVCFLEIVFLRTAAFPTPLRYMVYPRLTENPFFCLLEDSLVTGFQVRT
jgi:hypothetical protein